MINLSRIKLYREIWKSFNMKYSVDLIGETIELIELTKSYPAPSEEFSYEIWQKWLSISSKQQRPTLSET